MQKQLMIGAALAIGAVAAIVMSGGKDRWTHPSSLPGKHAARLGYLSPAALPDSLALLPPPPVAGSDAMDRDEQARLAALAASNPARSAQAASDIILAFPHSAQNFVCAFGLSINQKQTPHLYALLARMLVDVRAANYRAINHYRRLRPYVVHRARTCTPDSDAAMAGDYSYPSGQSAVGRAYALVLAQLNPSRREEIIRRGDEFAQSRLICDIQWQSDVDAGRIIGEATLAAMRRDPTFQADMKAARAEVFALGSTPALGCSRKVPALAAR